MEEEKVKGSKKNLKKKKKLIKDFKTFYGKYNASR